MAIMRNIDIRSYYLADLLTGSTSFFARRITRVSGPD